MKWYPGLLHSFNLAEDLVYIVLGPRQVGKTTLFKLLVRKLLSESGVFPRCILYLNCEELGSQTPQELSEHIESYINWVRTQSNHRLYVMMDEATYVKDWERSVKIVADRGLLKGVTLIATGSHAAGLRRGAERLPGRRGRGEDLDLALLPLSFREYLVARKPELKDKLPQFPGWGLNALFTAAQEVSLYRDSISPLFEVYFRTGGFPRSMRDEVSSGHVKQDVYKLYKDAFVGDLIRLGRRESLFRELAQWIINHRSLFFDREKKILALPIEYLLALLAGH
ncbi:MAG: AAA family ATPase [bacterium]